MVRALLFAITGVVWAIDSILAQTGDPFPGDPVVGEWPEVLLFSGFLLGLAASLPAFASWVGPPWAVRASWIASAGAILASASNILEVGVGLPSASVAFVAGTAVILVGLTAVTAIIAIRRRSILAAVPAICLIDIVSLHAFGGGVLVLLAWLVAATVWLRRGRLGRTDSACAV